MRSDLLDGPRRLLRRLLRLPASDWAGRDPSSDAARRAWPIADDNRYEVVSFDPGHNLVGRLSELAASGHRVFRIVDGRAEEGSHYELVSTEPRITEVRLSDPPFESLDRLRRDHSFGATVSLVGDRRRLDLAEQMRASRGWPVLEASRCAALDGRAFEAAVAKSFPLVSIVIVTHNNRELNRLCLESLFARTEWPRFEVLVVDNGSTDGTPDLLAGFARRHSALRVIGLAENRGFPAGCNIGLAEAGGDILVLLNNDTVLTRGWLTSLQRHLVTRPRLGLVGPVTNAIANEAKVEVGYRNLDELPSWTCAWVREHDGEAIEIPMLAFFCVAFRRETFASVGPLDERFGLGLFEDGDYNRRTRAAGWQILCARDAFVHHWQNASFRRLGRDAYFALYEENRAKFETKWRPPGTPKDPASS